MYLSSFPVESTYSIGQDIVQSIYPCELRCLKNFLTGKTTHTWRTVFKLSRGRCRDVRRIHHDQSTNVSKSSVVVLRRLVRSCRVSVFVKAEMSCSAGNSKGLFYSTTTTSAVVPFYNKFSHFPTETLEKGKRKFFFSCNPNLYISYRSRTWSLNDVTVNSL